MIAITVIVPFSMIVIGSLYVDECPTENNIPVYLIVGGLIKWYNCAEKFSEHDFDIFQVFWACYGRCWLLKSVFSGPEIQNREAVTSLNHFSLSSAAFY